MMFDWQFWAVYLPIVTLSIAAGWWLRGVHDWAEHEIMDEELRIAKRNHPAFRERWEWD